MPSNKQDGDRKKTWRLFSVALLFAILAGIGAILYLKILEHRLEERLSSGEKQMMQVVVANRDLPVGSKVDSSTMAVRKVPAEYVNSDVITPNRFDTIQGALLVKPLGHGKMLSEEYIDLNLPKNFSDTIKLGHRAVTIQVGEINSISGLIRPGNYIDLYARLQAGSLPALAKSDTGELVVPVLEDVFVLATDHRSARPNEDEFKNLKAEDQRRGYDTLTLEVTPKDAALISLAESRGSLVATLRNTKDTSGVLFSKVSLADLVAHSDQLLHEALNKQQGRSLEGVHRDQQGRLVTQDGTIITDPNVHLNKDGLLVNKDGVVLSGRNLEVGEDGTIRIRDGKTVDTAHLTAGKDGTLVDSNGTVLNSNGYTSVKGGFLVDKDGHVLTHNGERLAGVTVGKDGKVRTRDGRVLNADTLTIDRDGTVSIKPDATAVPTVDKEGRIRTAAGALLKAGDLVTVGPDGVVRAKDGTVLKGVTAGKDGALYSADGKKMSAADVLLATQGFKAGKEGTVIGKDGKIYQAKDLLTVDKDGVVRTKDGTVINGAYVDKNGQLRNKDGSLLTAQDVLEEKAIANTAAAGGEILDGVTGHDDPAFAGTIGKQVSDRLNGYAPYEVEYIVGGSSNDGAATTFKVQVEDGKATHPELKGQEQ